MRFAIKRLATHWVYGGFLVGLILFLLTPIFVTDHSILEILTYLALPTYMMHQYEEHDADRFRLFVNTLLGPSHRGLSIYDVFIVNVIFVWLTLGIVIDLTLRLDPQWSSVAAWLLLVNAAVHIAQAIVLKRYNPGLLTAIVLFIPLGIGLIGEANATLLQHLAAIGFVVLLHLGIVLRAL